MPITPARSSLLAARSVRPEPAVGPAGFPADPSSLVGEVQASLDRLKDLCAEDAGARRAAAEKALEAILQREAHLQSWHDTLQATQARLAAEHEAVTGALETRRAELEAFDQSLSARSAELAARQEGLAAREASLRAAEGDLFERQRLLTARVQERADSLDRRAIGLREAESATNARVQLISEQHDPDGPSRAARQAELVTLRATVAALRPCPDPKPPAPDADEAAEALARLTRQRDGLARELTERERLIQTISAECLVLRSAADSALVRAAEQDRKVRRLEGRLADATAEIAGQSGNLETQRALLRAARSDVQASTHRLESFRAELDLRHEELSDRDHDLDLREADLEQREHALESRRSTRPVAPRVTAAPAGSMAVPADWFGWAVPRRRRAPSAPSACSVVPSRRR